MSEGNRIVAELSSDERSAISAPLKPEEAFDKVRGRTIPRRKEAEHFPLSFAQQRLWFFSQLEPDSTFYNIPAAFGLTGQLNVKALEQSLNEIVRRHEALRTTFTYIDGEPRQRITDEVSLSLPFFDLSSLSFDERRSEVKSLRQEVQRPFDLEVAPLVRASLLRLAAEDHVLFLTIHHIVSDGWSLGIIIGELASFYAAFVTEAESSLAELRIQYADFAVWQREWLTGEVLAQQLGYWRKQLGGTLPVLELPTDKPRPAVQTFRGAHLVFEIGAHLAEELKGLSRRCGVTLYMTLLSAFNVLLYRYTGQEEIIVGTPIANRNLLDVESLVGFFVNTLVLRSRLQSDMSFEELLSHVREVTLGAYVHQDLPFEKLVEELQPERSLSRSPLFQVMFSLQNAPMPPLELPGLKLKLLDDEVATSQFDLTLDITEDADELLCTLEFNTDLFEHSTAHRMFAHFENLLKGIVRDSQQQLSQLPLLTRAERQQLLLEWNDTAREYPHQRCIHELFEAQAEKTPEALAVIYEDEQLTYRELNLRANQLAHHLQQLGVGPEARVGILLERSIEMAVALLSVVKAGGVYVPLDSSLPHERLRYMLEDAGVDVLLTQKHLADVLPVSGLRLVCVDADALMIKQCQTHNPESRAAADNLVYLIYTSGTTGQPKGILVPHRALVNTILAFISQHHITPHDRILQFASLSFDVAAEEFFASWLGGACAVMRAGQVMGTHAEFVAFLEKHNVTVVNLPSFWAEWLRGLEEGALRLPESLRRVVVGNEKTLAGTLDRWRSVAGDDIEWSNAYGPTETTITASNYEPAHGTLAGHNGSVPIGRPVMNAKMYILDRTLQAVPIGVVGELCIGGAGLARGYHNQPAQTAERFIPNPHSLKRGERLYRTGDLARYLPDGNIEFLGRVDEQVKIRGFRIELAEIESTLVEHPQVREALVIALEDESGDKRLVAYTVAIVEDGSGTAQDDGAAQGELRRYLAERLPEYMIPQAFVMLRELPLTPNGKIDRKALPAFEDLRAGAAESYVAPRSELERNIASVWQETLKVEKVGIHDNFFGLGGHSLSMIQLNGRLRELLQCELSMIEMFKYPTVSALAGHLSERQPDRHAPQQLQNSSEMRLHALTRQRQLKQRRRAERQQSATRDT